MGLAKAMIKRPDCVVPMNIRTRAKNCQVFIMSPAFQSTAVKVVFTGAPAAALVAVAGGPGGTYPAGGQASN